MTTTDLYLRFADEDAAISALPWARGVAPDGGTCWRVAGDGFALDPVGTLYIPGTLDADTGTWLVAQIAKPGWHANVRATAAITALIPGPAIITPATPDRVFG